MALVKKTTKRFIDLDLNFTKHPLTNDVSKTIDVRAITQALKNLVLSRKYDHPFHPEISSPVSEMLFEQMTPADLAAARRQIEYVIQNFEPRVIVQTVDIQPNYQTRGIEIYIYFQIIGLPNTYTVNFNLDRLI